MGLVPQLLAGLVAAIAATAAILQFRLLQQPLPLAAVIFLACAIAPILTRLTGKSAGGSAVSGDREEGEVKWFNVSKGFGFIRRASGEEIFVHFRSIRGNNKERRGLRDGQRVSFVVVDSDKGPQAEEVEPLH